jgi:hypothetical protein
VSDAVVAWITGVSAIVLAAAGLTLAIREVRRKERRDCLADVTELEHRTHDLQSALIDYHSYAYGLRVLLADHGIDVPDPPEPDEVGVGDVHDGRAARRRLNRLRRRRREPAADEPDDDHDPDPGVDDDYPGTGRPAG